VPKVQPDERATTPELADRAAVGRVAAQVELEDIRLLSAIATINVSPLEVEADWGPKAFMGYDTHANEWADDRSSFTVIASFLVVYDKDRDPELTEPPEFDPENPPDVQVVAGFELMYTVKEESELTDTDLEHFAVFNGTFNAWPYWRELAQTATQRMRIPPLVVALLKVPTISAPADVQPADAT
jgi:hypothetical protein